MRFFLLCLSISFFSSQTVAAWNVKDDTGATVSLTKPATRIVSLAPDITEILFAAGAGNKLVGVINPSGYPLAASHLPRIGSYSGIDLEAIIALHPDLIVSWAGNFTRPLQVLKKLGIPIYLTQPQSLEDIPRTLRNIGYLANTAPQANHAANDFLQRLAAIKLKYHDQKPLRVFYEMDAYSLMTVNKKSWINQVMTLCGGNNIFADAKVIAPEVTWESVVVLNPDVILSDNTHANWQARWQSWPQVTAEKNHLLFTIDPDLIDRAGPRLVEGAEQVCHFLEVARHAV